MDKGARRIQDNLLVIDVSPKLFDKLAVLNAAYRFTGDCHVEVQAPSEETISVSFKPIEGKTVSLNDVADAFNSDLVDQQLRLELEAKYGHLRAIIFEKAFMPISDE